MGVPKWAVLEDIRRRRAEHLVQADKPTEALVLFKG